MNQRLGSEDSHTDYVITTLELLFDASYRLLMNMYAVMIIATVTR
jgi:hypothetical protein